MNKTGLIKLILLFIGGFCLGLFTGIFQLVEKIDIDTFVRVVEVLCKGLYYLLFIPIGYLLFLLFKVKSKINSADDDLIFKKLDKNLSIVNGTASVLITLNFVLFGLNNFKNDNYIFELILFFVYLVIGVFIWIYSIVQIKKIYPEKKGDPLDGKFDRDWYASCDEAEKIKIGNASYKSYMLSIKIGFVLLFGLIILKVTEVADIFSVLAMGIMLTVLQCSYMYQVFKSS